MNQESEVIVNQETGWRMLSLELTESSHEPWHLSELWVMTKKSEKEQVPQNNLWSTK